jgi:hypothetical protein
MKDDPENPKNKKKIKFQHMEDCYITLMEQITQIDMYEENLNLLRQIIEVFIWGDQNKMPFTAVRFFSFCHHLYLLLGNLTFALYQS